MKKTILFILLVSITLYGCIQTNNNFRPKPTTATPSPAPIKFEIEYSFLGESSPNGWVELENNGTYTYTIIIENGKQRQGTGLLSAPKVQEIEKTVKNLNWTAIKSEYDCQSQCPTDWSTYTIKLQLDGKEKEVEINSYHTENLDSGLQILLDQMNRVFDEAVESVTAVQTITSTPPPSAAVKACPSVRPTICTREYEPVCGLDGRTYSNFCNACAAGTTAAYQGECRTVNASDAEPSGNGCALMRHRQTGQLACFGCAGTVCKDPTPDYEPYELPPGYIGIPYACYPAENGCQLAQ